MLTIPVYDGNNVLRRQFESGKPVTDVVPLLSDVPQIWVFDGRNALKARRELFPDYKAKRDRETPTINGAYDFIREVKESLMPHCQNLLRVELEGFEADDLIAALVTHQAGLDLQETAYQIVSNDGDFLALETLPNVKLAIRPKWADRIPASQVRLYKTLVGDSSDNIGGLKGFGDKSWDALSDGAKAEWVKFLQTGDLASVHFLLPTLKPSQQTWLLDEDNRQLLRTFWKVVGFMDITINRVWDATKVSVLNGKAYHETLEKFMWS